VSWRCTAAEGAPPPDLVIEEVAATVAELLLGSSVEARYSRADSPPEAEPEDPATASASDMDPRGWRITFVVSLRPEVAELVGAQSATLREMLGVLPRAALRTTTRFRSVVGPDGTVGSAVRRAVRDTLAAEVLAELLSARCGTEVLGDMVEDTLDFLIELSSTRVESHDLTHGIVITDVLRDEPRLRFRYPADVRSAKRAPLLFDGLRALLVVDPQGRARTELQRHRLERLGSAVPSEASPSEEFVESGSLVAEATRRLGGVGMFLSADRTIRVFVDGEPLLVRRGEHWTAFPLELTSGVASMIGGGAAARIAVQAAFMISGQRHGAILAIVSDPDSLDGIVPDKDRYDLRDEIDREAMRTETRLHHLIDAEDLDEYTLARLAILDGATILDREARLLAYGAVVASSDSQYEGARTAAARTLSETADVVLKVSADGDITIFREGAAVTTLLGQITGP
jgi:hypothetical protein